MRTFIRFTSLTIGIAALGWWGVDTAERVRFQQEAAAELEAAWTAGPAPAAVPPAAGKQTVIPERKMPVAMAKLTMPARGVEGFVQEGFDAGTLNRAIGHYPRSARPGARGKVILAAHRDTFFAGLRDVKTGDDILLQDSRGDEYRYRVTRIEVVHKTDNRAMQLNPRDRQRRLTLITCYPFSFIGPAPERLVVDAELVGSKKAARPTTTLASND